MHNRQYEMAIEKYITILLPVKKSNSPIALSQTHIPCIIDILGRKERHHAAIFGVSSDIICMNLLENIAQYLSEKPAPTGLQQCYFFYLDINRLIASTMPPEQIEQQFKLLCERMRTNHKRIILAINHVELVLAEKSDNMTIACLRKLIHPLLSDKQWRIVVITGIRNQTRLMQQSISFPYFSSIRLTEPTIGESLAMLKKYRQELEHFHQVFIPDDIFSDALSMASYYLSNQQSDLDKTLQLLDSSAARASAIKQPDTSEPFKPILTNAILTTVISDWTEIPPARLQQNKLKASTFSQRMQNIIFGQDAAISMTGLALQYAHMKLHNQQGPLCSFLFVGPANTGKAAVAYAIAEQLFGHPNALLRINLDTTYRPASLADINILSLTEDNRCLNLLDAIQEKPYAVVLLENINHAPPGTIDLFHDIFTHGYAFDNDGNKYDFRRAIVIITTTFGAEHLISLTRAQPKHATQTADLMQLVLNETAQDTSAHYRHLSSQELCDEIMPVLETYFSQNLLRHFNVIPFSPLDYAAVEKIIRFKLNAFAKQLDSTFGIELSYAAEVLRFLVQEILLRGETAKPIDKVLEQHLYSPIAHELLLQPEEKNRAKRLLLQLNETGQLLRCEFVAPNEATIHAW